ncbi:hypothetical protein CBR_g31950 [Chara braunii]|uniref:DNA mismatch repair proteins mutS family domain-containing protein n=1 Tax=Chara braunii TaxID=69332 RepID=A0A388LG36_CHABU|nr:hypothetical protein CBR_g31950 [Chara braunii]|eukprot:GBG81276.1 hypothetical protein CBR_g31950 [Chara braunii]
MVSSFLATVNGLCNAQSFLENFAVEAYGKRKLRSQFLQAAVNASKDSVATKALEEIRNAIHLPRKKDEPVQLVDIYKVAQVPCGTCKQRDMFDDSEDAEAEEQLREAKIFLSLLKSFNEHNPRWSAIVDGVAKVDVVVAFASVVDSSHATYCRPTFVQMSSEDVSGLSASGSSLEIIGLRHPYAVGGCVALGRQETPVVPNDVRLGVIERLSDDQSVGSRKQSLDGSDRPGATDGKWRPRTILLTGPNMGGKSTLLRATCLAVIMAQIGCYVSAERCTLSPVDAIFTRLGARDNILAGESTFMVECNETASVLRDATSNSLVVLDELGRGTSTFDGYAIAYGVLKHLTSKLDCRLLFATHYHGLTVEFAQDKLIRLQYMDSLVRLDPESVGSSDMNEPTKSVTNPLDGNAAHPKGEKVSSGRPERSQQKPMRQLVFLYKLQDGVCPLTYGLQVALLAGLPAKVVVRSKKASAILENALKESFERAAYEDDPFPKLHRSWLLDTVSYARSLHSSQGADDDAFDIIYCIQQEMKHSSI